MFGNTKSKFNSIFSSIESQVDQDSMVRTIKSFKSNTPSVFSRDIVIGGDIISSGTIEIEGKVKGNISGNILIIRENGQIEGKIKVDTVNIYGKFNGDITAKNINIFKRADVKANIEYQSLSVEDGASIDGKFKQLPIDTKPVNENDKNPVKPQTLE